MLQHRIDLPPGLVAADAQTRRPRIGIMGEFSAGKSTLTNLLIGSAALPVRVTATELPPVWLSWGDRPPCRVTLDGSELPIDLTRLEGIPVAETLCLRVFLRADVLELCDLIDFPGISDPNMAADVWERIAPLADCVLWCTHATQAWRQSEAAVWDMMPPQLQADSFLLLTRMDKIVDARDRARLIARVTHETYGLFAQVLPVSLLHAAQAQQDRDAWEASGAEALMRALIDRLIAISDRLGSPLPAVPAILAETPRNASPHRARPGPKAAIGLVVGGGGAVGGGAAGDPGPSDPGPSDPGPSDPGPSDPDTGQPRRPMRVAGATRAPLVLVSPIEDRTGAAKFATDTTAADATGAAMPSRLPDPRVNSVAGAAPQRDPADGATHDPATDPRAAATPGRILPRRVVPTGAPRARRPRLPSA